MSGGPAWATVASNRDVATIAMAKRSEGIIERVIDFQVSSRIVSNFRRQDARCGKDVNGGGNVNEQPQTVQSLVDGQRDFVDGRAICGRIVLDRFRDGTALDLELQRLSWRVRQANDAGFAITVCADFQIHLALVEYSVPESDFDLGVIKGLARFVLHCEIRPARADPAIHDGDFRRSIAGE